MKPRRFFQLTAIGLCLAGAAQAEDTVPAKIGVLVNDVTDSRTTINSSGECRVVLNLAGDAAADAYAVRAIRVRKAVDDLERDLVKTDEGMTIPFESVASRSAGDEAQRLEMMADEIARRRALREATLGNLARATATKTPPMPAPVFSAPPLSRTPVIRLRNPSRRATAIKVIEGDIDLFTPTEANGGLLRLPSIAASPAEFVKHDALARAGVKVMFVTLESYESKRAELGSAAEDPTGPWTDDFARSLKSQARLGDSRRPPVYFFVHDPQQRVMDLELQSDTGARLDRRAARIGGLRVLYPEAPLPANAQLLVRIATDAAISSHPFKLENIALP